MTDLKEHASQIVEDVVNDGKEYIDKLKKTKKMFESIVGVEDVLCDNTNNTLFDVKNGKINVAIKVKQPVENITIDCEIS